MKDNNTVIQLKDVTKTYTIGSVEYQALKGISFDIKEGEMIAIIGPSGSGKSTTMHILGGLDTRTTGQYLLNGKDVSKLSDDELAAIRNKEIGFVFQSFNLLPRTTVLDNVELPLMYSNIKKSEREPRAVEALKSVNLADKINNKSNQLSGGQIQRVAIARALVTHPSMILADEPTGNLDSKTSFEVMNIFQKMNEEGKTIIVITHEHDIANFCSRIITLKDGLIVTDQVNKEKHKARP